MQDVFTQKLHIPSYAVGADNCLRPTAMLQLQQEVGEQHMTENGLSFSVLREKGLAFVVTRLKSRITRLPQMGEEIFLSTWHRQVKGVQFFRNYVFTDKAGKPLIDSVTAFALVDTEKHTLLRPDALGDLCFPDQPEKVNACPDPTKEVPPALTEVAAIRPRWSELDPNGHVNNARYADFLCDNVPSGMERKKVKDLYIRFEKEILPTDRLVISAGEQRWQQDGVTGGTAWVTGTHARGTAFVANLGYEDDYVRRF
jgi:acyl-ACP thioesterase